MAEPIAGEQIAAGLVLIAVTRYFSRTMAGWGRPPRPDPAASRPARIFDLVFSATGFQGGLWIGTALGVLSVLVGLSYLF